MKIRNLFGCLLVGVFALSVGLAEAKPDQGKGGKGEKGGKAEKGEKGNKAEKGNKGGKKEDKDEKDSKKDKEDKKDKEAKHDHKDEPWRAHRFEDKEKTTLLDYFKVYESQPQGLPPGLAKNLRRGKPLPPGWEKKVSEGYILDDETYGLFDLLEDALFPDLKPKPDTRLYLYGDRVVRVYEPKRQVIDIIPIPGIKLK